MSMKQTKKQLLLYSTILHKIYTKHTISRIDIAKETGITPSTVSLITAEMLSEKLIQEAGTKISLQDKAGRKKILLSVCPSHSYYIGAEISEKFCSFVLTDNAGNVIQKDHIFYDAPSQMSTAFFIEHLLSFMKQLNYKVSAVGIAIPGHYSESKKGRILTNNPYWENFDLDEISARLPVPAYYSNNVHCMARAEALFYSSLADSDKNFIFFHVGRGIHCTHMYRNELYGNHNIKIGEVGHITVHPDGELCECGRRGCLQTYASEAWLIKKARFLYQTSPSTYLRHLVSHSGDINLSIIMNAYHLGDTSIIKLVDLAIKGIGMTITNLNMLMDASRVFIHGEIFNDSRIVSLLKKQLSYEPNLFMQPCHQQLIVKPYSPYTGAIGAAAFCVYRHLIVTCSHRLF